MTSTYLQSEMNDKLIEYLIETLAAENAAEDRIQSRIEECIIPESKTQLQHHLEETMEQQNRLRQIITSRRGAPTDSKADLPAMRLPTGIMTKKTLADVSKSLSSSEGTNPMDEEMELMKTKEDFGIENIEIASYKHSY